MDSLSKAQRSWNMSRIRGKNTKPEIIIRSLLHRLGYRFRLNRKDIPGKPDITLPKCKTVIYVHGCFWHRHEGCKLAYTPKSNPRFWEAKFKKNRERDLQVQKALLTSDWNPVVIWECELREMERLESRLQETLSGRCHDPQLKKRRLLAGPP
jgi:DNA mismatch endonuclease, patch repair protein